MRRKESQHREREREKSDTVLTIIPSFILIYSLLTKHERNSFNMPFAFDDALQHKRSERQRREIHEREYSAFISKLQRKRSNSQMSYISSEHLRDIKRSHSQKVFNRQHHYQRIDRENELISQRISQGYQRPMVVDTHRRHEENLAIFGLRSRQQRSNEYKRIDQENQLLSQRLQHARAEVSTKDECQRDWQRHVHFMKKTCTYPENLEQFVAQRSMNVER